MLMKKRVLLVLVALAAFLGYLYIYQDHRNIAAETSSFELTSGLLISEFEANPKQAESKYLDKTLSVEGRVTELNHLDVTLDGKIFCSFGDLNSVKVSDMVKVKGRCIGYDDLLQLVKMYQCVLTN